MISQFVFGLLLIIALFVFYKNSKTIVRNISLGKKVNRSDKVSLRLKTMLLVAFGQKKMFKRPIVALLHLVVYVGFCIINIEMLEIVIDGIFGTHRVLSSFNGFYDFLIFTFEILAFLVIIGCLVFLVRRNVLKIARLNKTELNNWPKTDANLILFAEILLMTAFLFMNGADYKLQLLGAENYHAAGAFPVSKKLLPILPNSVDNLILIERFSWWFHIIGVLAFLNYLTISKHLHIILAFPNTFFTNLAKQGQFKNLVSVTQEVKIMFDPSLPPPTSDETMRFGVKDVQDLTWKNLLDSYTCTECGRCTAVCPANITGKSLSPRKIMMDTRDRITAVGKNIDKNGSFIEDEKSLLDHYITREEIWACTTCNACVEECPVNINPLEIIMGLRQYSIMEESKAPTTINSMFSNLENNGAPWKYPQADRANWINN